MVQATSNVRKLHSEVSHLRQEVRSLRSLLISFIGEDTEGSYRPEFVREILRASRQLPTMAFRDAQTFLAELRHT